MQAETGLAPIYCGWLPYDFDSSDPAALEGDRERLRAVEVELDRCWDLLRQRRAFRDAGTDPEQAEVRDADTVERYLQ